MGFLKSLVDGLNHAEFERPGYKANYFDLNIAAMHFYHNIVFVHKGMNRHPSNILVDNQHVDRSA